MPSRTASARRAPTPRPTPAAAAPQDDSRADRWWLVGTIVAAAAILAVGWSSNTQFGDSSESVAGVESLGILHAPGYPAYVLGAKAFTILWPFGSAATQVNLFSVACSLGSVALAVRCGRLLGAERIGATVGGLALATTLSFWYYATYAKAYALTTLLLLGILCLLLAWKEHGGLVRLVGAGALLGLAAGASYQVVLLAVPGLAVLVFVTGRRPTLPHLAAGLAAAGAGMAVVFGYVFIRAGQDPAVNWGGVDDLSRFVDLQRMRDFGFGTKGSGSARLDVGADAAASGGSGGGSGGGLLSVVQLSSILRMPLRVLAYPFWLARDLGLLLLPLAAVGAVSSWRQKSPGRLCLTLMLLGNIAGTALVIGGRRGLSLQVPEARWVVSVGGFMLTAMVVASLWVGLGASTLVRWARGDAAALTAAERRRRERSGRSAERVPALAVMAVLLLALLGTAALNGGYASHRTPPFAETYARNVFASLPDDAVLLTWVAERAFALEEQQIVDAERTDVDVVRLEQINQPWYREQLRERLGLELELSPGANQLEEGADLATSLIGDRPVFLDHAALYYVSQAVPELGFRQRGLVAEVVEGEGRQEPDLAAMDRLFGGDLDLDGLDHPGADRWPNDEMLLAYAYGLVDYASALANVERYDDAVAAADQALTIDPGNETAQVIRDSARQRIVEGG